VLEPEVRLLRMHECVLSHKDGKHWARVALLAPRVVVQFAAVAASLPRQIAAKSRRYIKLHQYRAARDGSTQQ
ncbi:MAG: hypothetical protein ACLQOO_35790, partial [Terriglobia bacterium]